MASIVKSGTVKLDPTFGTDLARLEELLMTWSAETQRELKKAHKRIGIRHKAEAAKRVPVETGRLRSALITNVYEGPGTITTETGTNVTYGKYVEFGTKHIAKGNVLALGDGPEISDAQAIKVWPAKNADRINAKTGKAHRTAATEFERRSGGTGLGEQMPWLRSAFWAIRKWALQQLFDALKPPAK